MVAQKGLSAFLKDGVSVVEFFTGTKWDLANTAESGLPYTGALPLIVTSFATVPLSCRGRARPLGTKKAPVPTSWDEAPQKRAVCPQKLFV